MDWNKFPELHGKLLKFFKEEYEWCQDWNAKDSKEQPCDWGEEDACYFCLMTAVYKLYNNTTNWSAVAERMKQVFNSSFWEYPAMLWNDQPDRTEQELFEFLENHRL